MSGTVVFRGLLPEVRRRRADEEKLQQDVILHLRWVLPDNATAWACPNGGKRVTKRGQFGPKMGVQAGQPDLEILYGGTLTLIELKTPQGQLSAVQRQRHQKLAHCGAPVFLCRSVAEVDAVLREAGIPLNPRVRVVPVGTPRDA